MRLETAPAAQEADPVDRPEDRVVKEEPMAEEQQEKKPNVTPLEATINGEQPQMHSGHASPVQNRFNTAAGKPPNCGNRGNGNRVSGLLDPIAAGSEG